MNTPEQRHPASLSPPGPASRLGLWIVAGVLIVDQISKLVADATLEVNTSIDFLPVLGFYLTYNPGIAFSFLHGSSTTVLLAVVIAVTLVVLVFWIRAKDGGRMATVGFGLIVGGAIGNIVDRIVNGHVVDFLRLFIGDRTFFVFNLADFALSLGPVILVVAYFRVPKASSAPE